MRYLSKKHEIVFFENLEHDINIYSGNMKWKVGIEDGINIFQQNTNGMLAAWNAGNVKWNCEPWMSKL